jgi:hypothetical protein
MSPIPTLFFALLLGLLPPNGHSAPAKGESAQPSKDVVASTAAATRVARPGADDVAATTARAVDLESKGDLTGARDAWLSAIPLTSVGAERDACVAGARRIDARLLLRDEIVAAVPTDQHIFAELGIEHADADGLRIAGARVAWNVVPLDLLERAGAAARASRNASNGAVYEALARGNAPEKAAALVTIGHRLDRGDIDQADAFAAVARARNEPIPAKGYAFRKEAWSSLEVLEANAAASGLEDMARKLESAPTSQRDALIKSLEALGPESVARLDRALESRWDAACKALAQGTTLKAISAVADARRDLDARRKHALDLIFDEVTYFYPYNPPECPPEKAKLYAGVQQEVDTRVAAVREAWKIPHRVTVPAAIRTALEELDWNRSVQKPRKLAFVLPADVPAWIDGIDRDADAVDLKTFAWDGKERAGLKHDERVEALNARLWKDPQSNPACVARSEEQKQVLVTNEYRKMLGRRALAWNPLIEAGARGHSDYMANSGDFSHFEKDPTRKTPTDRLHLAGYTAGGSENISMGDTSAEGAHQGWIHSSGHHRNILGLDHHEMGAACTSLYWTQNFGAGLEFEKQIGPAQKP